MLTWQDNSPSFSAKGVLGDEITLYFGQTMIDDIIVAEFHLIIRLIEIYGVWSSHFEWHELGERKQKPEINAFMSALNVALIARTDFDLNQYLQAWSYEDPNFAVVISKTFRGRDLDYRRII